MNKQEQRIVADLMKERETIKEQLDSLPQLQINLRAKLASLDKLIVLYDPVGQSQDANALGSRRDLATAHGECLVPECHETAGSSGRCTRHAQRWANSEATRVRPDARECLQCPEEAGRWVKGERGLAMHTRTAHPAEVVAA